MQQGRPLIMGEPEAPRLLQCKPGVYVDCSRPLPGASSPAGTAHANRAADLCFNTRPVDGLGFPAASAAARVSDITWIRSPQGSPMKLTFPAPAAREHLPPFVTRCPTPLERRPLRSGAACAYLGNVDDVPTPLTPSTDHGNPGTCPRALSAVVSKGSRGQSRSVSGGSSPVPTRPMHGRRTLPLRVFGNSFTFVP